MNDEPIYLFATWQAKDGQIDAVLDILRELAVKSREEEGNLFYKIHQGMADKNTIILYEGYKDEAALAAHRASEHFQSMVIGKAVSLLENRVGVPTVPLDI
ncbi:putative quinol monooxygenase [Dyadobacter luticola]|uniref:Antibiotic biosynthesis monooxygenase n=1 Tax=Dyadobacter luticola TaxID=1979387 RepID=A0A5R9L6D9_9BACT|nr:putative quinol monooxygenase [Dyadobacter luticola]TLV03907.1 antibiotic biosynthesis monooxygenase [Dyadobacter luticola]